MNYEKFKVSMFLAHPKPSSLWDLCEHSKICLKEQIIHTWIKNSVIQSHPE